jgi:uncharacterized phiE125 gp8 family phage protein
MPLILTSGPAKEPVTLDEAKAHLRINTPYEDTLIASLILAARLHVERSLDTVLISQNWSLYLDRWPQAETVTLPLGPVQAVTAVRTYNADDGSQVFLPDLYSADTLSKPARLRRKGGGAWPTPGRALNGIEIAMTLGYGDDPASVPAALRHAIVLLVAHWYEVREPVAMDSSAVEAPLTVAALLHPYRQAGLR